MNTVKSIRAHWERAVDQRMCLSRVLGSPRSVAVEVNTNCNIDCVMCPQRLLPSRAIEYESFLRLAPLFEAADDVSLFGTGEPFLHPRFDDMVAFTKSFGLKVRTSTNATLLDRARARRLVECGLDELGISVDGATAESFDAIRRGASFHEVIRNIKILVEEKERAGSSLPQLNMGMVILGSNFEEMTRFVELGRELGVDGVSFQNMTVHELPLRAESVRNLPAFRQSLREAKRKGLELNIPVSFFDMDPSSSGVNIFDGPFTRAEFAAATCDLFDLKPVPFREGAVPGIQGSEWYADHVQVLNDLLSGNGLSLEHFFSASSNGESGTWHLAADLCMQRDEIEKAWTRLEQVLNESDPAEHTYRDTPRYRELDQAITDYETAQDEREQALVEIREKALPGQFYCKAVWNELLISMDGRARPCCFLDLEVGNVFEQGHEAVQNGRRFLIFRSDMLRGRLLDKCARCHRLEMRESRWSLPSE